MKRRLMTLLILLGRVLLSSDWDPISLWTLLQICSILRPILCINSSRLQPDVYAYSSWGFCREMRSTKDKANYKSVGIGLEVEAFEKGVPNSGMVVRRFFLSRA